MNKITYYPTMFHTNPFSFNMIEFWDHSGKDIKDIVLKNNRAKEIGVSKMMLNVIKFSVFDKNGNEFFQNEFPERVELNSKGIDTEFFVNTKSTLALDKGTYTSFRFYLYNTGSSVVYNDRRKESVYNLEYLDFEIRNDLIAKGTGEHQVRMRFDFKPFSLMAYLKSIKSIFKKPELHTGKLANC